MSFEFAIVGSGPAGSILAWKLAKLNYKIAIIDRAFGSKKKMINDFFLPFVNISPNYYTPVYSNLLGGNSALWHGKVYLISKKEFETGEWPMSYDELIENSRELSKLLKISTTNLEKIVTDDNINYHYSERCGIENIFSYLNISDNPNIVIFNNSSPVKLFFDDEKKIKSILVKRENYEEEIFINKSLIFCAGGLGNPHLLLNLISEVNGNLGKFLSDHPHVNISKVESNEIFKYKKILKPNIKNNLKNIDDIFKKQETAAVYRSDNIFTGIQLDYKTDPMRFLRRFFLRIPYVSVRKILNIIGFFITKFNGLFVKFGLISGVYYKYSFEFFFSQSQNIENKVCLDIKSTDKFGLKKINIDWNISLKDQIKYNQIINHMVGENGILRKSKFENNFIKSFKKSGLAGLHPSCTTKMGENYQDSVVDKNLKLHEYKNIFVCGSSVFPINGITNPTWTIMTLANRLSNYLRKIY